MPLKTKMIIKLLDKSIKEEKKDYNNYLDLAKSIKCPAGKRVLSRIAQDELNHIDLLITEKKMLEKDIVRQSDPGSIKLRVIRKSASIKQKAINIYEIEDPGSGSYRFQLPAVLTELENDEEKANSGINNIFDSMIEREKKLAEFYSWFVNQIEESYLKDMLIKIIEVEKGHLILFEDEKKHFQKTGSWFDPLKDLP